MNNVVIQNGEERVKTASRNIYFAAIKPVIETNIVEPTEKIVKDKGNEMVYWGASNNYPDYLLDLYSNCATLRSIINGCIDFVVGDDVTTSMALQNGAMNRKGDSIRDIVKLCVGDYLRYGGFALQLIKANDGSLAEIYYVDLRFLRTNKDCNTFYYSEEYTAKYRKSCNINVYPAWMKDSDPAVKTSIVFVKNTHTQVYPTPLYAASIKACETERSIDTFHLNAIKNGFTSTMFVNFNNGDPGDDDLKREIEKDFNEKFAGESNAGRIGYSWNSDKAHAVSFEQFKMDDFGSQYDALSKHCRQQIFTAFRANPNLFGIPTESLGFSEEEYNSAFQLFNRTQIKPIQDLIIDTFDKIFGVKNSITITPFTLGV